LYPPPPVPNDQVGYEQSHLYSFVDDLELRLLHERYSTQLQFYGKRILVRLLQEPMSQYIDHFHRSADDLFGLCGE